MAPGRAPLGLPARSPPRTIRRVALLLHPLRMSLHRRSTRGPRPRLLECGRCLEHAEVGAATSDDLKPDGHSVRREPGWERCGGLTGEVEGVAEPRPREPVPL